VPRLGCDGQLVRFLLDRVGGNIPSPAILGRIGRAYVEAVDRFALDNELPVVRFAKGACKEDVARPYLRRAERERRCGVVLIGVAQEKAFAWRGWRDGGNDEHPHFEFGRQAVYVNHYYFYILDSDWGPGFIKANAYAPYPVWVYLNGHEWAKRQAGPTRPYTASPTPPTGPCKHSNEPAPGPGDGVPGGISPPLPHVSPAEGGEADGCEAGGDRGEDHRRHDGQVRGGQWGTWRNGERRSASPGSRAAARAARPRGAGLRARSSTRADAGVAFCAAMHSAR
jgi:hypothetical protein